MPRIAFLSFMVKRRRATSRQLDTLVVEDSEDAAAEAARATTPQSRRLQEGEIEISDSNVISDSADSEAESASEDMCWPISDSDANSDDANDDAISLSSGSSGICLDNADDVEFSVINRGVSRTLLQDVLGDKGDDDDEEVGMPATNLGLQPRPELPLKDATIPDCGFAA